MSPDERLMQSIKTQWGSLISTSVAGSLVPEAFIAALIANETGGVPSKKRFEPAIYRRLLDRHPDWDDERVRENATSLGLTQIMGENYPGPPAELADPATNLSFAVKMLLDFSNRFGLDPQQDFEGLFRCWNTGRPAGIPTYDPAYVPSGLARMAIYEQMSGAPPNGQAESTSV